MSINRTLDKEILGIIYKQEEEKIRIQKIRGNRLWAQIELLKLQLKDPSISRSGRRNIRAWMELKINELNELNIRNNE